MGQSSIRQGVLSCFPSVHGSCQPKISAITMRIITVQLAFLSLRKQSRIIYQEQELQRLLTGTQLKRTVLTKTRVRRQAHIEHPPHFQHQHLSLSKTAKMVRLVSRNSYNCCTV